MFKKFFGLVIFILGLSCFDVQATEESDRGRGETDSVVLDKEGNFNKIFKKRHRDLTLPNNSVLSRGLRDFTGELLYDHGAIKKDLIARNEGLRSKNIATLCVHYVLEDGSIVTFKPNIYFLSGIAGSAAAQRLEEKSPPPSVKVFLDGVPAMAIRVDVKDIKSTREDDFYFFDSNPNENERLLRLMNILLDNIEIYSRDISFCLERPGGRVESLEGERLILSTVFTILRNQPTRDPEFESINKKFNEVLGGRQGLIVGLGETQKRSFEIAQSIINLKFAHAEQSAFEFIFAADEAFKKHIHAILTGRGITEYKIIDILTNLDMCNSCFKTMFLKAYHNSKNGIRIIGRNRYESSRDEIVIEDKIPSFSFADLNRLYVKML